MNSYMQNIKKPETIVIKPRITVDSWENLKKIATAEVRSISNQVQIAINYYLESKKTQNENPATRNF